MTRSPADHPRPPYGKYRFEVEAGLTRSRLRAAPASLLNISHP